MAKATKEYSETKWAGKPNYECDADGCDFKTLSKELIEDHVATHEDLGNAAPEIEGGGN